MVDIQDIVEGVVNGIDKTINVTRVEDFDLANSKLFVCELKWLKEGDVITDDQDRPAIVTSIGVNFITVLKAPTYDWTSKTFTINKDIYFFRGTPLATNQEWKNYSRNESGKTPFVWLVEPTSENFKGRGQSLERESQLRLYFLDSVNPKSTTKEAHDNIIKYLNSWVDGFFLSIRRNKDFAELSGYDYKAISWFGIEGAQGYESIIIDSNLCAVELRFTLPIRKGAKCLC